MPLVQLQKQNFDTTSLKAFSSRNFTSGSSLCFNTPVGESGCVPAVRSRSKCIKDINNAADSSGTRGTLNIYDNSGAHKGKTYLTISNNGVSDKLLNSPSQWYCWKINRNSIKYEIPEPQLVNDVNESTSYTKKSYIKNNLYYHYKTMSTKLNDYNYGFTNYNSLNFFTLGVTDGNGGDPDKTHKTCLIYHNDSGRYTPDDIEKEFTFECWINPKRSNINGNDYNYGTIIHIPYLLAVYLAKGSSIDEYGNVDKFRIQVQLGDNANDLPDRSLVNDSFVDNVDSKVISKDNCLNKNHWHHIAVSLKESSVIIYVDGNPVFDQSVTHNIEFTSFDIENKYSVITVGNRLSGTSDAFWNAFKSNFLKYYFGNDISHDYAVESYVLPRGVSTFDSFDNNLSTNNSTSLALNAEINDIRLYKESRLKAQIDLDRKNFVNTVMTPEHENLIFYVPVYYIPEKISRKAFITAGSRQSYTEYSAPVNPYISHRILGHEVSVEHFVKEIIQDKRPYVNGTHDQSYTAVGNLDNDYTESLNFNEKLCNLFLEETDTASRREDNLLLRNYLVLPCDNGLTTPGWKLIDEKYSDAKDFIFSKDIFGNNIKGNVSVHSLVDFYKDNINEDTGFSISTGIENSLYRKDRIPDAKNIDLEKHLNSKHKLNLLKRTTSSPHFANNIRLTKDFNSKSLLFFEVTADPGELYSCHFDISNTYYSSTIKRGSLSIEDRDLHGTAGVLSIKIKDNEEGQMYRHDSLTSPAKWNTLGHVFYNEGIVNVLHPGLSTFGSISFEMDFKSEQGVNVFEVNIPCDEGTLNVSKNKSYKKINPTNAFSDKNADFVFIDSINLHDENLNIVAKANLSKPLSKRIADKYNFRLKLDY